MSEPIGIVAPIRHVSFARQAAFLLQSPDAGYEYRQRAARGFYRLELRSVLPASPHVKPQAMLDINDSITLPERELSYRMSRSSGPGGQNVNKVETRVTVLFDVDASSVLSEEQKALVHARLATRIDKTGVLRVVSQKHRTQGANRDAARARLAGLLAAALVQQPQRRRTRKPKAVDRRRLEEKRRRSEVKRLRKPPID